MAGNLVISQINGGPIGVINAIINGNFQINQRAVSGTVTLAAGIYGHDRWKAGASGATYTFATTNNVTVLTISAGSLIQVIEGVNLYSGTYALSFSGTAQGKIGAGSFAASGVTGTAVGGTNLNIEFNTGTVSLVQFEPGSEISPFERRDIGRELILCQRYLPSLNAIDFIGGQAVSITGTYTFFTFSVQARVAPTGLITSTISGTNFLSYNSTGSGLNVTAITFVFAGINSALFTTTVTAGLVAGNASAFNINTGTGRILFTGCEL